MGDVSEQQPKKSDHRSRPTSEAFKKFIAGGLRHLVAAGLIVAFGLIFWATYDKDAIT